MKTASNRISGHLDKFNLPTLHVPTERNGHLLRPMQDDLGLEVPSVYFI